ncbi:hypothetical protein BRC66_03150 [Halobacteriales archaeon QH_2_66_30]|nr:MAG: hypothetical protein BRC66_03150 [Halobacteriales archaeon QH_2_66_30]
MHAGKPPGVAPEPAPLARRTPAFLLDQFAVILLVVPPALAAGVPFEDVVSPGDMRRVIFLVLMAVAFVYHLLLEWLTGLTLGKRALGLRVVADDGTPLGIRGSLLRNALRLIDGLGYWGVAVAVILIRGDGKRLGDVAGRTLVVRDR